MPTAPAPSLNDLFDLGRAEATSGRPDLAVNEGDISEMVLAASAFMADHVAGFAAGEVKATFFDGCTGDRLTDRVYDRTAGNVLRHAPSSAVGAVQITRSAPGPATTIDAGKVITTNPNTAGKRGRATLDADVNWLLNEVGTKSANATAVASGVDGNVSTGALGFKRFEDGTLNTSFTIANALAFAGGAPEENDDDLKDRARAFFQSLRRGTLKALEYGVITDTPGVARATAVAERSALTGRKTGLVFVYIADAAGAANDALVAAAQTSLANWESAGDTTQAVAGSLVMLAISISLLVRVDGAGVATLDVTAIVNDVKAAIVARVNKLRIGEKCTRDIIRQAAMNVDPDAIIGCTVLLPAADVEPGASEQIRTDTGSITVA